MTEIPWLCSPPNTKAKAGSCCRTPAFVHETKFALGDDAEEVEKQSTDEQQHHLSVIAALVDTFRKSLVTCATRGRDDSPYTSMEIGWPTNVRHVVHVTFDKFHGFLGLPVEFELEVPVKVPSASVSVFGVSAESMQCSFDSRGNSVPTILLLMQEKLYAIGGLQAEGIFRVNAENSQEETVRSQLNRGVVPEDIDPHCLAGLIKAWFRELPKGLLDSLNPEQVMQCNTEDELLELVKMLPSTQAALLDWAVNLMADIVQEEQYNKMNSRNVAMVFAPNLTQMSDPLTALMYAVQVMNLLKALIHKVLKERETALYDPVLVTFHEEQDENGSTLCFLENAQRDKIHKRGTNVNCSYSNNSDCKPKKVQQINDISKSRFGAVDNCFQFNEREIGSKKGDMQDSNRRKSMDSLKTSGKDCTRQMFGEAQRLKGRVPVNQISY